MNALVSTFKVSELFGALEEEPIVKLFAEHARELEQLVNVSTVMTAPGAAAVLLYFVRGNAVDDRYGHAATAERVFDLGGATKALHATYWQRALDLTDVWDAMPQKRRDEWIKSIEDMDVPAFTPETVLATLNELLGSRLKFFAERVDGCFQALSGAHVTNRPEGFTKRMIFAGVYRSGFVHDLRACVAKLMGRKPPHRRLTQRSLKCARFDRCGKWLDLDGGSIRVRAYKKGTVHIEVHPTIAYRLNEVLNYLHPRSIPAKHRQPPRRSPKTRTLFDRLIPNEVLRVLACDATFKYAKSGRRYPGRADVVSTIVFGWGVLEKLDPHLRAEITHVLASIGGHAWNATGDEVLFDYDVSEVFAELLASAKLPDQRSYQYYPTPPDVAAYARAQAQLSPKHLVLEPSAGQGALAQLCPDKARVTCVEVSELRCKVLRAKGFYAVAVDFLTWADEARHGELFDRVLMNPPFTGGQARVHVERAAELVKPGGRLVAILPASLAHALELPGYALEWSAPFENAFKNTSASVVVLTARRRG